MTLKFIFSITLFLSAFVALYYDTLAHILKVLSTPDGSHGFLIVAVSLYLIWRKREDLKAIPVNPALLPGVLLSGLGCFMLFAGKLGSTMLLQQISMVPTLLGVVWLFLGFGYLKAILLPVAYLIFLTGIVEEMLGNVSIRLQTTAAWIASRLLGLIGMPVLQNSTILELPHISLEVVKECSGINHIVALLTLAVPLAYISQRTLAKKSILVLAALLIGVFANGLRIALIGVHALYNPGGSLHGPAETLYVSFVFFFGMVVLLVLNHLLSMGEPVSRPLGGSEETTPLTESGKQPRPLELAAGGVFVGRRRFAPLIAALIIFTLTLGLLHFYKPQPVRLKNPLRSFPTQVSGFTGKDLDQIDARLKPFPADDELMRVYEDAEGNRVELYVGYFEIQGRERKIVDYRRDWMHQEAVWVPIGPAGSAVSINQTRLRDKDDPRTVFFWYDMDGEIVTGRWEGKFRTLFGALFKRRTNAAVVVVNSPNSVKEIIPFLTEFLPAARNHLAGM